MATKTLYVGNLPYSTNESELLAHFAKYSATNVRLVEGRGFGFVDIDEDRLAEAIADNNQKPLQGRNITVNEALPKGSGSGGAGGGGGGGNRTGSYSGGRSSSNRGNRW